MSRNIIILFAFIPLYSGSVATQPTQNDVHHPAAKVYHQEASGSKYTSADAIRLFFFHAMDLRPKNE